MEYLTAALLLFILGNIIWLTRKVSSLETIVKRLDKKDSGGNTGSGVGASAPGLEPVNL